MLNLAEYRKKPVSLADYLPWACLVAAGVILNKDGSFLRGARYRGPDLDSATDAELVSITARLNNVLKRFGSRWAMFFEAERIPAQSYPGGCFADPVSWLVDEERKAGFEAELSHFESRYYLSLFYLPPADAAAKTEGLLYERDGGQAPLLDPWAHLDGFISETDRALALLANILPELVPLHDAERELGKLRRQWFAKRKSVMAVVREVMFARESALIDTNAGNKAADADAALQELGSDDVTFGCKRCREALGLVVAGQVGIAYERCHATDSAPI